MPSVHTVRCKESTAEVATKASVFTADSNSRNKRPTTNPRGWYDIIKEFANFGVLMAVAVKNNVL